MDPRSGWRYPAPDSNLEGDIVREPTPDAFNRGPRRGTGQVMPTKFSPPYPTSTPDTVFVGQRTYCNITRFIHRQDPTKVLIYTDGACINNGQANPKAGWAFVQGPRTYTDTETGSPAARVVSDRLENKGPFGDVGGQTSNRAELRAVIAALRFGDWPGERFATVVIATDSEYVSEGATNWARNWIRNGWRTQGGAVKNKDLWEALLGAVERLSDYGTKVEFWRIPRELNSIADAAAKKAAAEGYERESFMDIEGLAF